MTEDQMKSRADHAKRIMDDAILKEAFAAIKERQINVIKSSELSQTDRRETAFKIMKAVDEVWYQLQSWVNEGKLIDDRRKLRKQQAPNFETTGTA